MALLCDEWGISRTMQICIATLEVVGSMSCDKVSQQLTLFLCMDTCIYYAVLKKPQKLLACW